MIFHMYHAEDTLGATTLPTLRLRAVVLLCVLFIGARGNRAVAADDSSKAYQFFEEEVRPILANRCYECHGPDKKKGGLRLDNLTDFQAGGNSGTVVVAGKPKESMLIDAIHHTDPDFSMPPEEKLPAKEIAVLEKWVTLGAPWPQTGPARPASVESRFSDEDRKYWAFQPLAKVTPIEKPKEKTLCERCAKKCKSPCGLAQLIQQRKP